MLIPFNLKDNDDSLLHFVRNVDYMYFEMNDIVVSGYDK